MKVKALVLVSLLCLLISTSIAAVETDEDLTDSTAKPLYASEAFFASVSMIIVSEIGDKTFFIAAILAMKHGRVVVFAGAIGALALMTALSAAMGFALPNILPKVYTHYASIILFAFFGVKLLREVISGEADSGPSSELEEVEHELAEAHVGRSHSSSPNKPKDEDAELGHGVSHSHSPSPTGKTRHTHRGPIHELKKTINQIFPPIFLQSFTMTFLAEWGDRSQIATIALAARGDPVGVTFGGILGHACCTGVAVYGGKLLASRISERTVALVGGVLFLLFALHSMYVGP
jgi:putative Ca2+/H+ antiporter (TMEM165/GDT1 family)